MGTIESILIEILTTRTNAEIRGIKAAYKQRNEFVPISYSWYTVYNDKHILNLMTSL